MSSLNGKTYLNIQDMCIIPQTKSAEEIYIKMLEIIGLSKTLERQEEDTGEVGPGRVMKGRRIERKLVKKEEEDIGQGRGMNGCMIETKLVKKGEQDIGQGTDMKGCQIQREINQEGRKRCCEEESRRIILGGKKRRYDSPECTEKRDRSYSTKEVTSKKGQSERSTQKEGNTKNHSRDHSPNTRKERYKTNNDGDKLRKNKRYLDRQ